MTDPTDSAELYRAALQAYQAKPTPIDEFVKLPKPDQHQCCQRGDTQPDQFADRERPNPAQRPHPGRRDASPSCP